MEIDNQVFIVTGGASGLGAATVRMLVAHGGVPIIADLDPSGEVLAHDVGGHFIRCDVTQADDAQRAVDVACEAGRLGGLINCAGIAPAMRMVSKQGPHSLDLFSQVIAVNLTGTFNMIRLAAAAMVQNVPDAHGERGVMINTASIAAFEGQIGQAAYAASKGGIVSMTLAIARDLARDGIRCMTIAPGVFETPMMQHMPAEVQTTLAAAVPFPPRLGKPDEYAQLVCTILTNPMLNGETIRIDGAVRMPPR